MHIYCLVPDCVISQQGSHECCSSCSGFVRVRCTTNCGLLGAVLAVYYRLLLEQQREQQSNSMVFVVWACMHVCKPVCFQMKIKKSIFLFPPSSYLFTTFYPIGIRKTFSHEKCKCLEPQYAREYCEKSSFTASQIVIRLSHLGTAPQYLWAPHERLPSFLI